MRTRVKMCGITTCEDACMAGHAGADCIGIIVEVEGSARSVSANIARDIVRTSACPAVVLLEKPLREIEPLAAQLNPFAVQLIGTYDIKTLARLKLSVACQVWPTVRIPQAVNDETIESLARELQQVASTGIDVLVFDTLVRGHKGGTGKACDWHAAAQLVRSTAIPVFLAGGILPQTAREAIDQVRPYGIDVSSGIEARPGCKDPLKMASLMRAVHNHPHGASGS